MNSESLVVDEDARRDVMLKHERALWNSGITLLAGVDEAGRGPLAGPVVACAVVFSPEVFIPGVNDSKLLTPEEREELYDRILNDAIAVGVGQANHTMIDRINILNATYRAMHEAVSRLSIRPEHLLIDGNRFESQGIPFTTIIDGDALSFSIAASSIVAKVTRDRIMVEFDKQFPGYGFAKHKGYATKEHREAIFKLGYCEIHRRSFVLNQQLEFDL
ncbi:MAG: ribonuclease HII [Ignavibacteriae bacterium]|nr:ribonuclease HII [Ignavibacteriota bacterium]